MYIKKLLKYMIRKINSLEHKADLNYSSNPFLSRYASTIVWVDKNNGNKF